ncbi:hypothetical protein KY348_06475 [Candidatus Woesearchaeota archaeon]|nr:hypothetical protein [Candidatus Woesearchaeota archaeon]
MTVGISFTNGLEAIVITDSRVSGWGRQSDSINKLEKFEKDNYSGVMFGSGSGNKVEGILTNIEGEHFTGNTVEEYVASIHKKLREKTDEIERIYAQNIKKNILNQAEIISDPNNKKDYIKNEESKELNNFRRDKRDGSALFALTSFDKQEGKIRQFQFHETAYAEQYGSHIEIGSGADGAHWYFTTKLQGMDNKKLKPDQLAFYAMNAYSFSTMNRGVGGTPKMAHVSKQGVKIIPLEQTRVLANLSGAYLAELPETKLDYDNTKRCFKEVLNEKEPRYDMINMTLGFGKDNIAQTTLIPYASWQEKANSERFNGNKK